MESILLCNFLLYQNKVSIETHSEICEYFISILCKDQIVFATLYEQNNPPPPDKKKKKSKRCVSIKNPKTHFLLPISVVRFVYIRKIKLIIITQKQTNAYEHVFFKLETSKRAKIVYK